MSKVTYEVWARWWSAKESPTALGPRFIETLDELSHVAPVMNNWEVWNGRASFLTLPKARLDMAKLVANGVRRGDDRRPDPDDGYSMVALGAEVERELRTSRSVDVSVSAGSIRTNEASIGFGGTTGAQDLELMTYPLFRGAVEVLASTWPCPWVEAYAYTPNFPPLEPATLPLHVDRRGPPQPREEYHFPWILYLSAPFARGLKPSKDLLCEPTPGGGIMLSAVTGRLDPTDPEHVRRSRLLQAIIAERLPPEKPPRWSVMAAPDARLGPY